MHRFAAVLVVLAAGCIDSDVPDDPIDESFIADGKGDAAGIKEATQEAAGVLALVNYASSERLRETGISASALRHIDAHRNGPDKLAWSADDDGFDTLTELDAVKYVGRSTFERLLEYAQDAGFVTTLPTTPGLCDDALTSVQTLRDLSNGFSDELFGGAAWYRTRACHDTQCEEWTQPRKVGEPEDTWLEFQQPGGTLLQLRPTLHRGYKAIVDGTPVDAMWDISWFVNVETATPEAKYSFGVATTRRGDQTEMATFTLSEAKLTDTCLRVAGTAVTDAGDNWRYEDEYTFVGQW